MSTETQNNTIGNNRTVRFDDLDVGVTVNLAENTASRDRGLNTTIDNLNLVNPTEGIGSTEILEEALAGNLYYNFHTKDFPFGEVRGQLSLVADNRDAHGVGEVVFTSNLSGAEEVQEEPVETDAMGTATTTFNVAADGSISYSVDLDLDGLNQADLLPVNIGNGTLSPIHLHNAPVGENGPVVVDIFTDAGEEGITPVIESFDASDVVNVEQGLNTDIDELHLVNPTDGIGSAEILEEALAGNIYYNFHTKDFPFGEVRGQLNLVADNRDAHGVGEIVFTSNLSGAEEVQEEPVETDAMGTATTTFNVAADGSISYSVDLDLDGLNQADLLPVDIGNGTLSPIHLHNAPVGENGPVVVDIFTDAGEEGITPVIESFNFADVVNVFGSNDADIITGDFQRNSLQGLDGNDELRGNNGDDVLIGDGGDDTLIGGGNNDHLDGGDGNDILIGDDIFAYVEKGENQLKGGDGNDTLIGGSVNDVLLGGGGDDLIIGGKGDNKATGGAGIDSYGFDAHTFTTVEPGKTIISDFDLGEDLIFSQTGNEQFSDLKFSGSSILSANTGKVVFILDGVHTSELTEDHFENFGGSFEDIVV